MFGVEWVCGWRVQVGLGGWGWPLEWGFVYEIRNGIGVWVLVLVLIAVGVELWDVMMKQDLSQKQWGK